MSSRMEFPRQPFIAFFTTKRNHVIRPHSKAVKPLLTDEGKMKRVLYRFKHLQLNMPLQGNFHVAINPDKFGFVDRFSDAVQLDEKWFFLTKEALNMYLGWWDEQEPHSIVVNKSHIEKVIFCCTVARPQFYP